MLIFVCVFFVDKMFLGWVKNLFKNFYLFYPPTINKPNNYPLTFIYF